MSDPDSEELLSNISDTSFVILGTGSLPNQEDVEVQGENSSPQSLINSKSTNTCFDSIKSSCDDCKCLNKCSFAEESIQRKLNELVKENCHLKETLSQNNVAIKSQLDTFFMWQQEVLKTHEAHKQKFLEIKDLVLKLRTENLSLKKQLQEKFFNINNIDHSGQISKTSENSDAVKERSKEFESICSELVSKNDNLSDEGQKLIEKMGKAKNEVLRLVEEMREITLEDMLLNQSENFQKYSGDSMSYKSLPNAEACAGINNLLKQLGEERGKVLKLKEALRKSNLDNKEANSFQIGALNELSHCTNTGREIDCSVDLQNPRISGLYSWVTLTQENQKKNNNLKQEDLKGNSNLEEEAFEEKQESMEALKEQFTKLLDDYKILQQQLDALQNENKKSEELKKEIEFLSAELQNKNKECTSKQQECSHLKEELEKLSLEWNEKLSVLQIQADLYRHDFNCEREARERLAEEKVQLAEQIILLQNQIEELEKSHGSNFHEKSTLEPLENKGNYKCPKCLIRFADLHDFDNHIYDCIDLN